MRIHGYVSAGAWFAAAACTGEDPSATTADATDTDTDTDTDTVTDTGAAAAPLDIAGTWVDGFGSDHVITGGPGDDLAAATWTQTYPGYPSLVFHLSQWDNAEGWVVGHNDDGNGFDPGLWSRFDWTTDTAGALWYCQSAFAEATEDGARAAPPGDPTDLTAGCGGFPWTDLAPAR